MNKGIHLARHLIAKWPANWLALFATLALLIAQNPAHALSGDPNIMECDAPEPFSAFEKKQCWVDQAGYVPPDGEWRYPVAFIYPAPLDPANKLQLKVQWSGYSARPWAHCTGLDHSSNRYMVIKDCGSHYPDVTQHAENGQPVLGWGGWYKGNSESLRLWLSLNKAVEIGGDAIDHEAGIILSGPSYGGTTAINQAMILRYAKSWMLDYAEIDWGDRIAVVDAQLPQTLIVRDFYPNNLPIQRAWEGQDLEQVDIRIAAAKGLLDDIYWHINGSPADTSVKFSADIFRLFDKYKISAFGTYHNAGHTITEPGVNLPYTKMFAGEQQAVRRDQMLPVFTASTANYLGRERGHYNLGLSWAMVPGYFIDSAERIVVPLRYKRHTAIGGGIPDQPTQATFTLTVRRTKHFALDIGTKVAWELGAQQGVASVTKAGEVTIPGLTLKSATTFTGIVITRIHDASLAPLVYTRQPRLRDPITTPGFTPIGEGANWQHWYDAGKPDRFTEADLVLDHRDGTVEVLYDCTTSPSICAAHDQRVSPDGKLIAFTVARGDRLSPVKVYANGPYLPAVEFKATSYELWIYDTVTEQATLIERDARMPDWPNNHSLVFASSRAGVYPPWAYHGNDYPMKALNIFEGTLSGNRLINIVNRTPHAFAMNPVVLSNGWRCYSAFNGFAPRVLGTPANAWWPECYMGNGTGHRVIANAHGSTTLKTTAHLVGVVDPNRKGVGSTAFRVLRGVSEIRKGVIAYTNYYRANHLGAMGIIFAQDIPGPAEGFSQSQNILEATHPSTVPGTGRYTSQVTVLTPYGQDYDGVPRWGLDGKIMGKAGFAAASPVGEFIFTQCDGSCYEATLPENANRSYTGGLPTAHRKIMLAKVPRVTNPRDPAQVEVIACADEQWNCWDARYVVPYRELFGQDEPDPAPLPVSGTTTTLRIVNARAGELAPLTGWNVKPTDACSLQGCAEPDWQSRIAGIRIDKVDRWKTLPPRIGFAATSVIATCPLKSDGSVKCVIPCNIDYQLRGVDKAGVVVATDNTLHPAVCGETVTCHGCHDAHGEERVRELGLTAEVRFNATIAGGQ